MTIAHGRPAALALTAVGALLVGLAQGAPSADAATAGPALVITTTLDRAPISPDIYGASYPVKSFAQAARISLTRWGGNSTSRYNWTNKNTNTGSDWYFENVPGSGMDKFLTDSVVAAPQVHAAITVPVIGWVAKDTTSCGFPTSAYGTQQGNDVAWRPNCGNGNATNGSPLVVGLPQTQTSTAFGPVGITAMTTHLAAINPTTSPLVYQLDNEPSLWNSTHRDVQPDPIAASTLFSKSTAAADAILAGDPNAVISGPGDWGWCAYFYYPKDNCAPGADRTAHRGLDLAAAYLAAFQTHDVAVGHRTLDVLDEHFYPQGTGIALTTAGDAATQALRLRSTRALWDPTYVDESWISTVGPNPNVQLIPRMRQWIASYYPGTGMAIGEYNFGGLESINGALAQADVLGILGREGVRWAALWSPPSSATEPGTYAFRMFRNLDGAGASFGTTRVRAVSADQDKLSVYAATRADGTVTAVVVNKSGAALTSKVTVAGTPLAPTGTRYEYAASHLGSITTSSLATSSLSAVTFPADSITTLVLPKGAPASALTLTGGATVLTYPATTTLTARLSTTGKVVAGARVTVYGRPAGTTTWIPVVALVTSSSGVATATVRPARHMLYTARDLRPATASVTPAPAATPVRILSRRGVTLAASASTTPLARPVTLTVRATPAAAGLAVFVQRRIGTAWSTIASGRTNAAGVLTVSVRLPARGAVVLRALVGQTTSSLSGTSAARTITVT